MRFTEGDSTRGYLQGVLLDGAKPFLHRNGVRTLLGVADGGGSVAYAPPPPPAGFQYLHRSGDGPAPDMPAGDHQVVREYPDRLVREAGEEIVPRREVAEQQLSARAPAPTVSPMAQSPKVVDMPVRETQRVPQPERESVKGKGEPMRGLEKAEPGEVSASFEIPGISRTVQDFPALRSTVAPEELLPEKERAAERPNLPPKTAPSFTAPVDMPRLEREPGRGRVYPEERTGPGMPAHSTRQQEKIHEVAPNMTTTDAESPLPVATPPPSMPSREIVPVKRSEALVKRGDAMERGAYLEPADPTAGALVVRGSIGVGKGLQGVEQIVERVIARREEERGGWEEPRRPWQAPQPVQVVVTGKPAAGPKIPCAFWERSYLHRFRIRTLR